MLTVSQFQHRSQLQVFEHVYVETRAELTGQVDAGYPVPVLDAETELQVRVYSTGIERENPRPHEQCDNPVLSDARALELH